jgi:hypothetical protein
MAIAAGEIAERRAAGEAGLPFQGQELGELGNKDGDDIAALRAEIGDAAADETIRDAEQMVAERWQEICTVTRCLLRRGVIDGKMLGWLMEMYGH